MVGFLHNCQIVCNFDHNTPSVPRGKKSGREKTVVDVIYHDIDWPHYFVQPKSNQKAPRYDDLSLEEFVYGYLRIVAMEQDGDVKAAMLSHLEELMLDARQYSWPKARAFHGLIVQEMERGALTWLDTEQIQTHRHRRGYISSPVTRSQGNYSKPASDNPPRYEICNAYNSGSCPHEKPHDGLKHSCSYCFGKLKRLYKHPECECRRKDSKNDQSSSQKQSG